MLSATPTPSIFTPRIVIDTNLWIRALLGGRQTLPVLRAWQEGRFAVIISDALLTELEQVWQRPRLKQRFAAEDARYLLEKLRWRGVVVEITTIPPRCRAPRDQPVLATAIDGQANAIVSGDADLRADDELRAAMASYGVELWGMDTLLKRIDWPSP
jgi:putative PIN family toxin of toxin-antitoxin system